MSAASRAVSALLAAGWVRGESGGQCATTATTLVQCRRSGYWTHPEHGGSHCVAHAILRRVRG